MEQTQNIPAENFVLSPNPPPETPNAPPGWQKCLSCGDYGDTCRGPSLGSLGDIASVRSFHKAMRKARKLSLKALHDVSPTISESTINEYFSNVVKDYKWTTIAAIDNALTAICGNRVGLPPLDHVCPASSSEMRNQLAAAELKIAAAELKAAQVEADAAGLREKLTEVKGKHISQLAQMEASHTKDMDWMKNEICLWRRFAFLLLGVGLLLLVMLVFYIGWDVAHPGSGFI